MLTHDSESLHLTRGHDNRMSTLIRNTENGMAHWAGTGPDGKTCRECLSFVDRGHYSGADKFKAHTLKPGPCHKFKTLMSRKKFGPEISPKNMACRFFEQHEDPPAFRFQYR